MIHQLIAMIQAVQDTPETAAARAEAQARRQGGLTDADLADLSAQAFQLRQARDAALVNQPPSSSNVEQFTVEAIAGGTAVTRRQRPGSSLGINA